MGEKRRKQVIFAVLVLAVAWGIYNQPWKHDGPIHPQPGGETPATREHAHEPVLAATVLAGEDAAIASPVNDWTIDPFLSKKPVVTPEDHAVVGQSNAVPVLQGLMTVGSDLVCVIAGKILKKGDRIGEWRVDTIAADQVEIVQVSDGRHITLRTGENQGK